jgi:hypothetical protein
MRTRDPRRDGHRALLGGILRFDRILVAAGALALLAAAAVWQVAPANASFIQTGGSNNRIVWASTRPQPAPINESNGELGLWTVNPSTVTCTSGGGPCTAWSSGDIGELTGFDATHCPNGNNDDQPFYSPVADKVVYRSDCNGTNHAIWEVTTAGTGVRTGVPLTTGPADDSRPSFAPDGHTVLFQRLSGHQQLWKIDDQNLPAGASLVYSDPNADALTPVYDPIDQNKIVFVSSGGGHDEIILLNVSANTITNLSRLSDGQTGCTATVGNPYPASCSTPTAFNDDKPDIASDAGRIVFSSTRPLTSGGPVQTQSQIWSFVFNNGGAGMGTLPMTLFGGSAATSGTGFTDVDPAYSPQNDNVTFQRTTGAGDIESFSMPISNEQRGTSAPQDNSFVTGPAPHDITPNWGSGPGTGLVPEVPYALLIPGAGLLVGGVTVAVRRRRRMITT